MIRKAIQKDVMQASEVLEKVKSHMLSEGIDQWDQEYPNKILLNQDINEEQAYIYEEQGVLLAYQSIRFEAFSFNEKANAVYLKKDITL